MENTFLLTFSCVLFVLIQYSSTSVVGLYIDNCWPGCMKLENKLGCFSLYYNMHTQWTFLDSVLMIYLVDCWWFMLESELLIVALVVNCMS